ncbi:hypothetical protein SS1G_05972 [Sclerotinia sclerotiorum 1980 UF-70]|uniref:Uncharacterized protein n=2 Tax=Sclerotinia sclerotiorum (strain ATCC 18683 / 1980 / Ss-1) TaxID=665079 RepID=A7EKX5_SCLS1|nr:hypothetical protein SS1G_05972 [Sclerotinia sclerotiorum 1980 UF-70]APA09817.1 hypothetical protein sscle_05g045870 [Sclerotinia sclerotiorum 1980 UF-70]EDO03491.1 hypothetical protein SS1G_05972 [Sclerotinia sclerotiorum 1980 UF-70]
MPSSVWLDGRDHSQEAHIYTGTLWFKERKIWENSCHDNTIQLGDALHKLDPQFSMTFASKEKTLEGHTKSISVRVGDNVILDKLSTHDNMHELVVSVTAILAAIA